MFAVHMLLFSQVPYTEPSDEFFSGDRALQEVLSRCENPTDAGLALKAIRTLRRHRAALQMHEPFTAHTTRTLMEVWRSLGYSAGDARLELFYET